MNEQTEKNINEAIDWLQKTGGTIQDFAVEQAPLYCREVVQWEIWSGVGLASACLVSAVIFSILTRVAVKNLAEQPAWAVGLPSFVMAVIFSIVGSAIFAIQAGKAVVAPRLVIVEHLRSLR